MSNFDKAIIAVLAHEGGYVNHPADPGGETNFGITKRDHPRVDIKHLTRAQAIEIYRRDYWREYMDRMPAGVAAKHFDMCVNMGHFRAVKLLQRAMGCDEDGHIGPITLSAVAVHNPVDLIDRLAQVQLDYYRSLVEHDPAKLVFMSGWERRAGWKPAEIA